MDIRGAFLPGMHDLPGDVVAERDGVRLLVPRLDPASVVRVCAALREARAKLAAVPGDDIIRAIDAAARALLDPVSDARKEAVAGVVAFTGYSRAMAERVLDRMAADWTAPPLERLVELELGGFAALDEGVPRADGALALAVPWPLGFHVFSGNVPGVNVTSMVRALLVRSAVFGKSAADEPALAPLFLRLLEQADPRVAAAAAVTWFPGGSTELEDALLREVDLVVHYGAADSIAALRARTPAHVHFVEHGPKLSCAVVDGRMEDEALEDAAAALAEATAWFDQSGCVSPQVTWIVGADVERARRFGERVAAAFERIGAELPRGRIDPGRAADIRDARTRAEFGAIAGRDTAVWQDAGLDYTVILDDGDEFRGSCLGRTVLLRRVANTAELIEELRPFAAVLQTVGIAGFDDAAHAALARGLAAVGASRITAIRDMPWPPPWWQHDGRGPLRELVRQTDLEGRF